MKNRRFGHNSIQIQIQSITPIVLFLPRFHFHTAQEHVNMCIFSEMRRDLTPIYYSEEASLTSCAKTAWLDFQHASGRRATAQALVNEQTHSAVACRERKVTAGEAAVVIPSGNLT